MQTYSGAYTSNLNFTEPGYRSLATSSVGYLTPEGLVKKSSDNTHDKYILNHIPYTRSKENLFPDQNWSKRSSIDLMKKSIQPSLSYTSNSSHEGYMQKSYDGYQRFDQMFTDKTNSDSNSKPFYPRKSLNSNSLSSLKIPIKSRRSYNFPSHENIISPQLKEFFVQKSRSKDKSPKKAEDQGSQFIAQSYHKRHPSSYGYLNQQEQKSSPRKSLVLRKNQQNYSSFFLKKKQSQTQKTASQNSLVLIEPLLFKNESNADISFSSEQYISAPQTEMTARFNFSDQSKNISQKENQHKLTNSLGKQIRQSPKKAIQLSDFLLGPCKGKGRYGKVYLAIQRSTGFVYALKQISLQVIKSMLGQFISELKIQLFLQSPYITKTYGYFIQNQSMYQIMEYMTDGNLYERIKKRIQIPQNQAAINLYHISQGLNQMHHYNVIHRDIKPQNIVMSFDVCKICDFSWAVKCEERRQTNCGTLDYLSPEMIAGEGYSSSIDLWAMGVLLYEMLVGKPPFYNTSIKETTKRIKQCSFTLPESLSKSAKQLIECFLQRNPDERKQIDQILKHKFFKDVQI